jgi:hypothetical protein
VVDALQALRGVPLTVVVTTVAVLGDLTRVDHPRPRMTYVGLTPAEYARGERRHQGGLTQTGNPPARRALVEGAWASRDPAHVSRHLPLHLEKLPKPIQDTSGKAQVRFPSPSDEGQPRCGVALDGVKQFNILAPRSRQAPDGYTSGGRQPTDISVITRRLDGFRLCRSTR